MAGVANNWPKALVVVALIVCAARGGLAQSTQVGSLTGKLTDLYSHPVVGATLVARNQATGAETSTSTTKGGAYRFTGLEPGTYTLRAQSALQGMGQIEEIVVYAGHESHIQAAMAFFAPAPEPKLVARRAAEGPAAVPKALPVEAQPAAAISATIAVPPANSAPSERSAPSTFAASPVISAPSRSLNEILAELGRGMPETATQVLTSMLVAEPLPVLALPGRLPQALAEPSQAARGAAQQEDPLAPAFSTTVGAAELQALPVTGRRWQEFMLDSTPASAVGSAGRSSVAPGGSDRQSAGIAVDGVGKGMAFDGGGAEPASLMQGGNELEGRPRAAGGGHGFAVTEAAIREVQTTAGSIESELARAGGRMNVETQRGGNNLHGQGFFFDRQNLWGAQNPFTQWVKQTAGPTLTSVPVFTAESYTPPDVEASGGIGIGGRIRRDRLFWFAALDGFRRNDPGLSTVRHPDEFFAQPSNDSMQVLSARLGLPSANPVAEGVAEYSKMLETLGGLLGPASRTSTQWTGFGRIDWQIAERHRATLEGIGASWNSPGGGFTRVSESYGSHSFGASRASEVWLLGRWEAFLSPNLLSVTQASAGRNLQQEEPGSPSAFEQTLLAGNAWGQLPQIVVDSRYGFTIGNPSRFGRGSYPDEHHYQVHESIDWVRGKLLVRAGAQMEHNSDATGLLRNQTGSYHYASVENFASDALVFAAFGPSDALDPYNQHNCDQTGRVWRDPSGTLRGLGNLPCYSYYTQSMGPSDWSFSTNDLAGYATAQWQPRKLLVLSAGLRWEREQMPPPIAAIGNPELPLTARLPGLGNSWGPRISLAWGSGEAHGPVVRLGYGIYFGRTRNSVIESALTETGSPKGDLNFFMRPTDDLPDNGGGAPPFPHVLAGEPSSAIKPGAVEFAPGFRNPEIHQAIAAIEERLPWHIQLTASAAVSLGRRLPISIDTNFDPAANPGTITYAVKDSTGAGPIKTSQITVPFYAYWPSPSGVAGRLNPEYQQLSEIFSRVNSTYEAWTLKVTRYGRRGLSLRAHYTYAHAMDWNPNESARAEGSDVLDPADFRQEYGTSNLDVRHSAYATATWEPRWKLHGLSGKLANGWMAGGIWQFRSGRPYTMRTSGALAREFTESGALIEALGPGMNGSGGDPRVYGVGRNTFRYPSTWKADLRVGRRFDLGRMRELELLAESFNLFNHQNVTELETIGYFIEPGTPTGGLPTLNFLTGVKADTTAFGKPLNINATDFYRERQIQLGVRLRF